MGQYTRATTSGVLLKTFPSISVTNTRARCAANPAADTARARRGIILSAPAANSGPVYVGDATVTTANGLEIPAGQSLRLDVEDPFDVFAICTAAQNLRVGAV